MFVFLLIVLFCLSGFQFMESKEFQNSSPIPQQELILSLETPQQFLEEMETYGFTLDTPLSQMIKEQNLTIFQYLILRAIEGAITVEFLTSIINEYPELHLNQKAVTFLTEQKNRKQQFMKAAVGLAFQVHESDPEKAQKALTFSVLLKHHLKNIEALLPFFEE